MCVASEGAKENNFTVTPDPWEKDICKKGKKAMKVDCDGRGKIPPPSFFCVVEARIAHTQSFLSVPFSHGAQIASESRGRKRGISMYIPASLDPSPLL